MFQREFQVNGTIFRGRIVEGTSEVTPSGIVFPHEYQLSNLRFTTFNQKGLEELIEEATTILDKLKELNKEG
ncbi:hypothetical protein PQE70_gp161 [Bacillus phage vB_BanS_Nate]|uniref:Uncharacterized protein n=1 Tax=Bacillus phage vB_BanS_Nate TaxID=2894788 RepID=A0AAE9CE45_9CAUD|nr:hypothetical protein PQE70_gp161 [Bacillus phage vB_BanS_Nate]UGO51014.1 hypothetical protein NATE_161 [Bacillus phage vB_BanS_Nate]